MVKAAGDRARARCPMLAWRKWNMDWRKDSVNIPSAVHVEEIDSRLQKADVGHAAPVGLPFLDATAVCLPLCSVVIVLEEW